jgi:hypothetical protein
MKKELVAVLAFCIIASANCGKESSIEIKQETVAAKILGAWMLVKHSEETFSATNNLLHNTERIGDGSDSLIFRGDGKLMIYSDTDGRHIEDYQVLNDQVVRIEKEEWKISLLNNADLHLVSEEVDANTKERDVAKVFLRRP